MRSTWVTEKNPEMKLWSREREREKIPRPHISPAFFTRNWVRGSQTVAFNWTARWAPKRGLRKKQIQVCARFRQHRHRRRRLQPKWLRQKIVKKSWNILVCSWLCFGELLRQGSGFDWNPDPRANIERSVSIDINWHLFPNQFLKHQGKWENL